MMGCIKYRCMSWTPKDTTFRHRKPRRDRLLTDDQVAEIRADPKVPLHVFAERHKMSVPAVFWVRHGYTYKDLPGAVPMKSEEK
jgi:hypothetical protein